MSPALSANTVAVPGMPRRSRSRSMPSGREMIARIGPRTADRSNTRQHPGHSNLTLADAARNFADLCAMDAARIVVEYELDRRARFDRLKAVGRKHADDRDVVVEDE